MTREARRILVPLLVAAIALTLVVTVVLSSGRAAPSPTPAATPATAGLDAGEAQAPPPTSERTLAVNDALIETVADTPALPPLDVTLHAIAPGGGRSAPGEPLTPLGSLDPDEGRLYLTLSRVGAGIERITLSNQWQTAAARHQAEAHYASATGTPPLPDDGLRYVLAASQPLRADVQLPVLAVNSIKVNGQFVILLYDVDESTGERRSVWTEMAPGELRSDVVDDEGRPHLEITRRFELDAEGRLQLQQRVRNVSDGPLDVQWLQYGPPDLATSRGSYIDRRRYRFGHLLPPQRDPTRRVVMSSNKFLLDRGTAFKQEDDLLWPNKTSREKEYELSWFAATNRYFALAIFPPDPEVTHSLEAVVEEIGHLETGPKADTGLVFTQLSSPTRRLAAGSETAFDLGVYAGPIERSKLDIEPYASLRMQLLVLYQMGSCCTACTFQWLANGLMKFLTLAHLVLQDWALAIILLVCVVRALLHPLTKRAQINMQMFGKSMSALKPEIEKIQKRFPDDPKKAQAEQLRLMREHGISPVQFLGCLPMLLQMPIWIALYAMLYFAFELRQQPAFYGVFQKISGGAWPFLADLSSTDRFIPLFDSETAPRIMGMVFDYSSINLLPLLMGILFFLQQKYMTPPPSPGMTKEQLQQQKIMKVMMVVMMPLLFYSAPSGLTLYILTSSTIGILESRYVRAHIRDMDLKPGKKPAASGKKKKPRDTMGAAYAAALERAEAKRRSKGKGKGKAQRSFKKKRR